MCTDNFGNAACEEIPDDDAAIVAAHRQQRAPAVERAGESHADTVQGAISLLSTHTQYTQWKIEIADGEDGKTAVDDCRCTSLRKNILVLGPYLWIVLPKWL